MSRFVFGILLVCTLIGCSNKIPECSDSNVIATFSKAIIEKYEEGIRPSLTLDSGIVETIKDEKSPDFGYCKATSKVTLNAEVLQKHQSLVKILHDKYDVKMSGSFNSVETVESKFKIKINEVDKNFFITGAYNAPFNIKSFIIAQVNDYEKILNIGSQFSKLNKFYDLTKDSTHSGSEAKQLAMENSMLIDFCSINVKSSVVSLTCRFSNEAGWVDLVYKNQNALLNFSTLLLGSAEVEGKKEKDPSKIAELLTDNVIFKYADYNNDGVCKVVPSFCLE